MNIPDVFLKSVELEASDIFISSGKVPVLRRNGGLVRLEEAQATAADELNGFRNSLLDEAKKLGVTTFNYGSFVTAVIDFIIMAFIIFLLVKGINKLQNLGKKKEEAPAEPAAPTTKKCPYCLSEIDINATRCAHCTSELTE